jgi:hypothetical protein
LKDWCKNKHVDFKGIRDLSYKLFQVYSKGLGIRLDRDTLKEILQKQIAPENRENLDRVIFAGYADRLYYAFRKNNVAPLKYMRTQPDAEDSAFVFPGSAAFEIPIEELGDFKTGAVAEVRQGKPNA